MSSILEILSIKPFAVIGHRGSKEECAENTLPCLEYAIQKGAEIVEVDARQTKDGKLIILHDETFERVAGISKKPSELTLEEIKKNIRVFGEYEVPTLEEVLNLVGSPVGLFVEIKEPPTVQKIVETVLEKGNPDLTMFISFYSEALKRVKEIDQNLFTGLIYSKPSSAILEAKKIKAEAVLPRWPLATPKAVAFAHRLKLKVIPWVVNDEKSLQRVLEAKADAIATDRVSWLVEKRKEIKENTANL